MDWKAVAAIAALIGAVVNYLVFSSRSSREYGELTQQVRMLEKRIETDTVSRDLLTALKTKVEGMDQRMNDFSTIQEKLFKADDDLKQSVHQLELKVVEGISGIQNMLRTLLDQSKHTGN